MAQWAAQMMGVALQAQQAGMEQQAQQNQLQNVQAGAGAASALDGAAGTSPEMIANKEAQAAASLQGPGGGGPSMAGRSTIPAGMA
jgi:hypothetical protein